jgi:hypothetical protein
VELAVRRLAAKVTSAAPVRRVLLAAAVAVLSPLDQAVLGRQEAMGAQPRHR